MVTAPLTLLSLPPPCGHPGPRVSPQLILTLSWPRLANAPILVGQARLSRAERELDGIWEVGSTGNRLWRHVLGVGRGETG